VSREARKAGRLSRRARAASAILAVALAWAVSSPAPAVAETHEIDGVNVFASNGFVYGYAWFKDSGPGQSWVHAWIDTYASATGQLTGSLGHRSGVTSCEAGRTCFMLLSTTLQAKPGECYVVRALSGRGASLVEGRAPVVSSYCV
jgi:hypothetical protein